MGSALSILTLTLAVTSNEFFCINAKGRHGPSVLSPKSEEERPAEGRGASTCKGPGEKKAQKHQGESKTIVIVF